MDQMFMLIKGIFFLIVVLLLANYAIRFLNRYVNQNTQNLEIIERLAVSKESSLCIVRMCGTYYFMTVGQSSSDIIRELTSEEVEEISRKKLKAEVKQVAQQTKYQEVVLRFSSWITGKLEKRKKS